VGRPRGGWARAQTAANNGNNGNNGKKDPSQDPSYRRGSLNQYYRKRVDDRRSQKGKSVSTDNQQRCGLGICHGALCTAGCRLGLSACCCSPLQGSICCLWLSCLDHCRLQAER
jgi:hypothetical protein